MKLFKFSGYNIKDVATAYEKAVDYIMDQNDSEMNKQIIYDKVPLGCIDNDDIVMVDGTIKVNIMEKIMKRG